MAVPEHPGFEIKLERLTDSETGTQRYGTATSREYGMICVLSCTIALAILLCQVLSFEEMALIRYFPGVFK